MPSPYSDPSSCLAQLSIEINQVRHIHQQPLLLHFAAEKISAGFPSPAQDYAAHGNFDLNRFLVSNVETTFLVRVASSSMRDAGIDVDDTLLVDRGLQARNNDIVIAMIDNEFTLKRLIIDTQQVWLKAENVEYQDIHFADLQELVIWGVVTFVIKKVRSV